MPVIHSEIDVHGEEFAKNREAMLAAVDSFRLIEQNCLNKAAEAKAKNSESYNGFHRAYLPDVLKEQE